MEDKEWKVRMEGDVSDLKVRMSVAENNIGDMKEDIRSIKDDTKWLRRTITGTIITAIVGGVIGLAFLGIQIYLKLNGGM